MVKISVIIPVYNAEEYLQETLKSVLGQSLKELEVLCVDDGSEDNSLAILEQNAQQDARVKVIRQANGGSGKARNNALSQAVGEFVAFMDADDFYPSKDTLKHLYAACKKYGTLISGGSLNQYRDGQLIKDSTKFERGYTFKKSCKMTFEEYQFDYGYWRFIYNRQFLVEQGIVFPDYLRQQDPPFFLKAMITAGEFYALEEPTYVYRLDHKNITWNERKASDLFAGVRDCLNMSSEHGLESLHGMIANRINTWTYQKALADTITSPKVRNQAIATLEAIDIATALKFNPTFQFADLYQGLFKEQKLGALVSIIVPVYNVEPYVARCLDSLVGQTFSSIEIICVNDGSTDNSLEVLKSYAAQDGRIKVLTKPNGGLSSARNYGLKQASGEYIMFVDSDDWIELDTVEKAVAKMIIKVDVVSWGADIVNDGLSEENQGIKDARNYHEIKIVGERDITNDIIGQTTYTAWNKLLKKKILDKYDLWFTEGRLFEDNDFMIKYFVHCNHGYFMDEYLYHYVQRPNSIMERVRKKESERTGDHLYIFDSIYQHFVKYDLVKDWSKIMTRRYLSHLSQAFKYAPDHKKQEIRDLATSFAQNYDLQFFAWDCLSNVQKGNYAKVKELNEFIVTLTSYPKRIGTVHMTVMSILQQSVKPDKVVLWLADSQFPNKTADLPEELLRLQEEGLTISWCEDLKSYKKLIPALKAYPEAVLITADDDVLYQKNWLKLLIESYINNPHAIHCHRAHKITLHKGEIKPYSNWIKYYELTQKKPGYLILLTGVGGVLYPAHCFTEEVFDKDAYMKCCPHGDDLWFWGQAVVNNFKVHLADNALKYPKLLDETQDVGLWHDNVDNQENDKQLKALLDYKPQIMRILLDEAEHEEELRVLRVKLNGLEKQMGMNLTTAKPERKEVNASKSWFAKKLAGGIQCYKEHGFEYTFKRTLEHLGIHRWPAQPERRH